MSSNLTLETPDQHEFTGDGIKYEILFSTKELQEIIGKTQPGHSFLLEKVNIHPASDKKLGFMCDHFKMKIKARTKDVSKHFYYFLKSVPIDNVEKKDFLIGFGCFSKEIKMYTIFETLRSALDKEGWFASFYFSNTNAMVFEDLSERGFSSLDPSDKFTKDHCLAALSCLARLHASCFAYEEKLSKELGIEYRLEKEHEKDIDKSFFDMSGYYLVSMNATLGFVEKFSKYAQDRTKLEIIKEKWSNVWDDNTTFALPSKIHRNVIVQRDLWCGNLMYRYNGNVPVECIVIDYQSVGWLPPAADVMDLLHMTNRRENRIKWESDCLNHYYSQLKINLLEDDIIVESILPKDEFLRSCQIYNFWGLMHSCVENHMIHLDRHILDDLLTDSKLFGSAMNSLDGRNALILKPLYENKFYRDLVLESLEELIEKYILS